MSEPSTADIIAALHGDQAALARVRGGRGSWTRTAEGIAAADRLAELDRIVKGNLPPCPTCGVKP